MTCLYALVVDRGIARIELPSGTVTYLTDDAGDVPDGVTVVGDTIYWTTMGAPATNDDIVVDTERGQDFSPVNGAIHAITRDGKRRWDVIARGGITTGKQLVNDGHGRLYWSDREGCRVSTARTDGSDLYTLVQNTRDASDTQECVGIAVDQRNDHFLWTQKGPSKGGRGQILRASLQMPDGQSAERRTDIEVLWHSLPEPIDLALVGADIYWTDRGNPPKGNTLNRARLPAQGENGHPPQILADGYREAIGLAVDTDHDVVYVADLAGDIHRVSTTADGRGPGELVASLGTKVTGIAYRSDTDHPATCTP